MPILPSDPSARWKMILAISIIFICFLWIVYFTFSNFGSRRLATAPDSPGWTAAHQINQELEKDRAFADVGVAVLTENPLKYVVKGGVYSQADLDRLPEALKRIKPDAEYELQVELLKR
ncbi:MAG TPA: hypothetical protein VHC70_13495 [Phycisphaerales bacterium]|nr:hypothetical protein [Phycisphaerales bacterium]